MEKYIKEELNNLFGEIDYKIFNELRKGGDVIFVGGCIRDILLNKEVKDFDLCYISKENKLDYIASKHNGVKNRFNGYKIQGNREWDIWNLEDTYAFRKGHFETSIENISKTSFFNCNAITYHYDNKLYFEECFFDFYNNNTLDINCDKSIDDLMNIARCVKFVRKYECKVSSILSDFINENIKKYSSKEINKIMKKI